MKPDGEKQQEPDLAEEVYQELRRIARRLLASERLNHTLQPTALVHEAWLRMARPEREPWQSKTEFLAVAAVCMRRLLVDHARGRARHKRGGAWRPITLSESELAAPDPMTVADLLTLASALERLAALDARQARIVELRFFAGMTVPEIAAVLGRSTRTIEDDWTHARAWLRRYMAEEGSA